MTEGDEVEREPVNLGLEKLQEHMEPGEIFITNAPRSPDPLISEIQTAEQFAYELEEEGRYESVRVIDAAFGIDGEPMEDDQAVVAFPKQEPTTPEEGGEGG